MKTIFTAMIFLTAVSAQAAAPSIYAGHCYAWTGSMVPAQNGVEAKIPRVGFVLESGEGKEILRSGDLSFSVHYKTNKYGEGFIELSIKNLATSEVSLNDITVIDSIPGQISLVKENQDGISCTSNG